MRHDTYKYKVMCNVVLPCPVMIVIGASAGQRVYAQSLLTLAVKMSHQKSPSTRLLNSNSFSTLSAFVATEKHENKAARFQQESSHCIVIFALKTLWKKDILSLNWHISAQDLQSRFSQSIQRWCRHLVQESCSLFTQYWDLQCVATGISSQIIHSFFYRKLMFRKFVTILCNKHGNNR